MNNKFSRAQFDALSPAQASLLRSELAEFLSQRLVGEEFHSTVYRLVDELRGVGHSLWSHDEDDDRQVWGPDYQEPSDTGGIIITFSATDGVSVEASSE